MLEIAVQALIVLVIAYLFGSIPFAYLLIRWFRKKDLRQEGSGNIGALNALRTGKSKPLALAVLLGDLIKGWFPTWLLIHNFGFDYLFVTAVATGVLIGHVAPVWLHFRGGRGLAVTAGSLLVIQPILVAIWLILWGVFFLVLRKHIVANVLATFLLPLIVFFMKDSYFSTDILLVILPLCFIIVLKHLERLPELLNHPEN